MAINEVPMNTQEQAPGNPQPVAQEPVEGSTGSLYEASTAQNGQGEGVGPQEGQEQAIDPKQKEKAENYISILMNELHSPDTRDDVLEILKSSKDPFVTVPQAALAINDAAAGKITKNGGKVDVATMFIGSQYLVNDLMEIGNAFGIFKTTEKDFGDLYQDSLQMYIQRGLKDGSIDPIELQLAGEQMMDQNQKVGGHYLAEQKGVPYKPSQQQILQQHENATRRKVQAEELDKQSKQAKMQNDQQVKQALLMQSQGGK